MDGSTSSLLTAVPEIRARAARSPVLVGLDFDGTLVPFADRPDLVRLDPDGRRLLESVRDQQGFHVAIVSGRPLDDVVRRVGVEGIAYTGNHGGEIRLADGRTQVHADPRALALARRVRESLSSLAEGLEGVWVEDKGPVIAVHHRLAGVESRVRLRERLSLWRISRPVGVREREGIEVTEFLPISLPTKGDALLDLGHAAGVSSREGIVYLGDDETDEEAFRTLGPASCTARVGPCDRPTSASFRLEGPTEVRLFLGRLASGRETT